MSKSNDTVLLVPGESGWEIWTRQDDSSFALHQATGLSLAGEIQDFPSGDLAMLFPVKALTAVPLRVTSGDDALFPDLAAMHAERLGLRTDAMAGQLTDVFVVAREGENTALLSVFLRSPADGELPARGPKGFDISPRAYRIERNSLVFWREFGRWVFALYHQGALVYCQATAIDSLQPDEDLVREARLALIQLSLQELALEPGRVVVWVGEEPNHETVDTSALEAVFTIPVEVVQRPFPRLPDPLSKLLPADVRAARRAARQKRNMILGVCCFLALYLGVIGWFCYGIWKDQQEVKKLEAKAEATLPDSEAYSLHLSKWDELSKVLQLKNSPVDILNRVASCIPRSSGLRLKTAEISAAEIKLMGEAPDVSAALTFSKNLEKSLSNFTWQTPPANQTSRAWEFVYTGEIPTETPPQ